jgi:enterochelin esterase family protein
MPIDYAAFADSPLAAQLGRMLPGMPEADRARFAQAISIAEPYAPGPDARPREGVPEGRVTAHRHVGTSVYPGVERDFQVYVPAGLDAARPANLMVFLDGARYLAGEAAMRTVFDNLIHAGEIAPTVAVFVEPGETGPGLPVYGGTDNRSVEYDSTDDANARFLVDELLPVALHGLVVTGDPRGRAICGLSSGGHAAFAAAWHRPEAFGNVVSHCGSFVALRGGDTWPTTIRRTPPKALRVFLQDGDNDLDIVFGHWLHANRQMDAALTYAGYDHRLVVGSGGHSLKHGGALLPDTLRWLWGDASQATWR